MPLRIAFFGLPLAALLLAEDGHAIELCAVRRRDAVGVRRATRRFGAARMLVGAEPPRVELARRVRGLAPDLVVSWFWTKLLPMDVVHAARLGGVGVHPSLLPRWRGPDPFYWAIASGDAETGVTAHRLEGSYDTGAILGQRRLRIDPEWNAWQLARALDRPSIALLREVVGHFARGEAMTEVEQDPALATAAPAPGDEACAIRWSWPTERVLRHVRALAPAPGAWTEIGGAAVTVLAATAAERAPAALAAGEACVRGGLPLVRTGDGAVILSAVEIDGVPADRAALERIFQPSPEE